MGRGEAFYSPMVRSQSFSDIMLLNYELHKCFSFPSTPCQTEWLECPGIGIFLLSHRKLEPAGIGSDNKPTISLPLISFPEGRPC